MQNTNLITSLQATHAELKEVSRRFVPSEDDRAALDTAIIALADAAMTINNVKTRELADAARTILHLAARAYDAERADLVSHFVALDMLSGAVFYTALLIEALAATSHQSDAKVATATYPQPKEGQA